MTCQCRLIDPHLWCRMSVVGKAVCGRQEVLWELFALNFAMNLKLLLKKNLGTSLAVQWLSLHASTARGMVSVPGQ